MWAVDALKAVASQVILWHHFLAYGPLARTLYPHASAWLDGLSNHGPNAVQVFLVIAGFLAARSLQARVERSTPHLTGLAVIRLLWKRYVRLIRPYLFALVLAMASAACARFLLPDPDTPAAPSPKQLLSHLLLFHDIVGVDALSAGVWYVAVDLQLYGIFLLVIWLAQRAAPIIHLGFQTTAPLFVMVLVMLSLLGFNRVDSLDIWAIYFFGSYGIGVVLHGFLDKQLGLHWLAILIIVCLMALLIEWRERLCTAFLTAGLLALVLRTNVRLNEHLKILTGWLGRTSYSVFLVHYPVVLLLGTVVAYIWPDNLLMSLVGLAVSWLTTMVLANWVYRHLEFVPNSHSTTPSPDTQTG